MKAILSLIISVALVVSGYAQTRNVLVGTNNAVVQPTNFWSADASNARTGLGLGTAATNPASAFQPSSLALTNLSANNGGGLTNLTASNIVGALSLGQGGTGATNASDARNALGLGSAATNPASAFQASSANLTTLAANNGGSLTNLQATSLVGIIPASNIATVNFSNLAGTLSIASGGTGATNAANARQNLGSTTVGDAVFIATNAAAARTAIGATTVGSSVFTLANPSAITFLRLNADNTASALSASDFRTALSLGTAATNPASAFQPASSLLTNLASSNGGSLTNIQASSVVGTIAISNGGSGATTAGGARTNLELGATNNVVFNSLHAEQDASSGFYTLTIGQTNTGFRGVGGGPSDFVFARDGTSILGLASGNIQSFAAHSFSKQLTLNYGAGNTAVISFGGIDSATGAAISRTNLGLGWPALTNTTASGFQTDLFGSGTNPVLVNTNGEVVSPTNFWDVAPIQTLVQNFTPVVNATNAATNARTLYAYSLAISTVGVTNVITLPTNTATKNGDEVTVIHMGPTSSITAVRQLGQTNNLITINKTDEAVKFIYENNAWTNFHNISFVEPIQFSGTNASANVAASRTNLGLGWSALTNTNAENFYTNTLTTYSFIRAAIMDDVGGVRTDIGLGEGDAVRFGGIINDGNITINQWNATNGLLFIYRTNNEPFLGLANFIASNNTTVSNESLFRVGVAEATNKAAQFGFRSTNTNGNGVAVFSVFGYNALMMIGPSDPNAGTNPIQATMYSVSPTNKVMTLISTNTGAMQMHRSLGFDTNLSSVGDTNLVPATNNQIQKWLRVYIGTNAFYLPLYQ